VTKRAVLVVVLMCLLSCCTAAVATDWYVATNGNDSNAGTIGAPFATLQGAIYYHAQPGDTVWVRAGTYTTFMNINGGDACGVHLPDYALLGGSPGAPITIRPYDGDFSAIFTGAVRIVRCKYLTLMGFEMYQPSGGHPLSVTSGCTGTDFYSPEHRTNHILVTNCKIHDGGTSSGQCKLQQSDYLTVQDCEFWNLGAGGAVLDCVYVNNCLFQRNYLHDNYSSGGFVKGGSLYNTFDSNIYVNPSTAINWGFLPGGQTDPPFCPPDVPYESMYTVIRNNIVKGAQRGALPSEEAGYCYAYNNLWYDCAGGDGGYSYVTCIPTGMPRHDNYARHFYIFNNIFYDPQGDMRAYGWGTGGGGYWEDWQTGNNCYSNNGQAITVDSTFINPNNESGAQFGDPHLTLSGSPTTRQAWINYFRPLWDSQSNAMLKDKANSSAGNVPYPVVIADIEGNPRPRDSGWDIGPYEYQGTVVTPGAEFIGNPLWGVPPATINFTDCSSGGPTAWSWNFGDGSTSTAKNPSHTYNSNGSYNVSLTAYNSAGNNNKTKNGYITIKPLDANFSASPVGGGVPLAVTFTDSSSNSPTAWSWTFGDGGTSTAQNPSHTYNTAGYYTVSLIATNANGSDTETKNNYITACTAVYVYPTACNIQGGETVISGGLSDLQTENGVGMEISSRTSAPCSGHDNTYWAQYYVDTSYTPDQLYGMTVEYKVKTTVSGLPTCLSLLAGLGTGDTDREALDNCPPMRPAPSSFTSYNHDLLGNMTHFMESDGVLKFYVCNQNGTQTSAYHIVSDVMRWRLYLKPGGTPAPVANFSGTPTSGTAPLAVTFTDSSTNTPTAWSWTFGDSSTSTAQNPSHTYNSVGSYTVALTATNAGGNNTNTKNNYITVGAAPVANFTGNPTIGAPTLAVSFTDTSTNTPTAWSWTFGDSYTSTAQNPSHSYTAVGNYTVALTATNAYGNNTNTKNNYITVGNKPVANFSGTPTIGAPTLAVSFADSSTYTPTAWAWTFGDSNTSTVQNPSHSYTAVGNYTVALTATNAYGNNTNTKNNYITVGNKPAANFSGTPTSGTAPLAVSFTDSSTYSPTAWSWTFGDSNTSTVQNPSHTYSSSGTYTVALTATNAYGNNTNTKNNYISVSSGSAPVANFTANQTLGLAPLAVSFTDTSTNTPTSWSWTFGDSSTSTAQNPSHTYTGSGYYTVALTATNAYGNNTNTKTDYITVCNEVTMYPSSYEIMIWGGGTLASGTLTDVQSSNDTYMAFDSNTSSQNVSIRYKWPTSYTPSQTKKMIYDVEWHGSRADTPKYDVSTHKAPDDYPTLMDFVLWPTTDSTYHWENATDPGNYIVNGEIWMDICGCHQNTNNYQTFIDLQRIKLWVVVSGSAPVADFSGTPTLGAAPLAVTFTDSSTNTPTSWSWTFGDSNTSTAQNPSHTYNSAGSYTVALTATNAYGNNTNTKNNYITVGNAPVANFSGTPTIGAPTLAVSFTDSSTNTPTAWSWTFGDSTSSTVQNPSHSYTAVGNYTVALTATNAYGNNTNTKNNYITVGNKPVANFSGTPTIGAAPLAVTFTDSSTYSPTAWSWTFGDSNTSTVQNPSHTYSSAGSYTVALTATNAYGNNTNTKNNYITAGNAPVANFSGTPTTGNAPLAVTFTDSSTNTPTAWSWTFGDTNTSTVQNPSHAYSGNGNYTVALTATNAYGNNTNTKNNYISVTSVPAPVANFSGTPTIGVAPLAVTFTDSSSNSPTAWSWTFGDSNTSTAQNPSHTYSSAGYYTVSLTATNAGGSDGETKTDYIVACNEVTIYPSSYEIMVFGGGTLASGSLTDVQSSNDAYMTFDSNTSSQNVSVRFKWTTSYTPAQTKKMIYDIEWHGTQATTTPMYELSSHKSDDSFPDIWSPQHQLWYTTDHTYNWTNSTDPGDYIVNGEIWMDICGCHQNTTNYQTAIDLTRIKLWVVATVSPPVANFSGTPTTGTAPLAVSFTDSSTNSPTAWSWDFGDSNTSTAQNPSHTYAAGTYTVSLTATNAGGSDGETKTNYITVTASAPTFVAAGSVASGTGAITPALPSGITSNDILLLFLETANEAISIANQNGGTWTQVSNSPQSVGTAGGSNGTRLTVFWSRYNGTQGAPTTSDSGNHQLGRTIAIRGATTSGDPCNITAGGMESTVDTSGAIPGATTTVANTLVVAAIATSLPDASGTANFSSWTNADLSSVTERTDNTVTAGNGGGLGLATGGKATGGAYTTTSVTCATASTKAMMSIAIKP